MGRQRKHEAIHAKVANKLGYKARVVQRRGQFSTVFNCPGNTPPVHLAAIAIAPLLLGEPEEHCNRDRAKFDAEIDRLPYRERAQGRRDAIALAKKLGR